MRNWDHTKGTKETKAEAGMVSPGMGRLYPALGRRLGRREEVLEGMWAGMCTKEIAAELGLSAKTVEYHRALLFQMFGVNDVVSLCRRAMEMGILRETLKR